MQEKIDLLDRRITALETRDAVSEVHHQTTMNRLSSIEDSLRWIIRLILGGLVMAVLGLVVQSGIGI